MAGAEGKEDGEKVDTIGADARGAGRMNAGTIKVVTIGTDQTYSAKMYSIVNNHPYKERRPPQPRLSCRMAGLKYSAAVVSRKGDFLVAMRAIS